MGERKLETVQPERNERETKSTSRKQVKNERAAKAQAEVEGGEDKCDSPMSTKKKMKSGSGPRMMRSG